MIKCIFKIVIYATKEIDGGEGKKREERGGGRRDKVGRHTKS